MVRVGTKNGLVESTFFPWMYLPLLPEFIKVGKSTAKAVHGLMAP